MRKAQKLETLMLELANEKKNEINEALTLNDDNPVIIDGVDERTGKMVEINTNKSQHNYEINNSLPNIISLGNRKLKIQK